MRWLHPPEAKTSRFLQIHISRMPVQNSLHARTSDLHWHVVSVGLSSAILQHHGAGDLLDERVASALWPIPPRSDGTGQRCLGTPPEVAATGPDSPAVALGRPVIPPETAATARLGGQSVAATAPGHPLATDDPKQSPVLGLSLACHEYCQGRIAVRGTIAFGLLKGNARPHPC